MVKQMRGIVAGTVGANTCVGAEVSLEMGALSVALAAAGVFAAVHGRSFFPSGPLPALPFRATRGQHRHGHQRLLVEEQLTSGLAVDKLREKVGVVVEMRHVGVVPRVRVRGWRREEVVFWKGHHGRLVQWVVRAETTRRHLAGVSSAVPVHACSLRVAELIFTSLSGKCQQARWIGTVSVLVELRLGCGCSWRQDIHHQAALVGLMMLLSSSVLYHRRFLVRRPLAAVVRRRFDFRRQGAPVGEQELNVPGCLAVTVQKIL